MYTISKSTSDITTTQLLLPALPRNIKNKLSSPLDKFWMFRILVLVHSLTCIVTFVTSFDRTHKFTYHITPMTTTSLDHFWVFVPLVLVSAGTCPIRQATPSHWTSEWLVASLLRSARLRRRHILVCCCGLRSLTLRSSILQSSFGHCYVLTRLDLRDNRKNQTSSGYARISAVRINK